MRKVNSAYSIYALIDPEHAEDPIDPKQLTNLDYDRMAKELPPASINELSLNVAQLLVSSGTMSQSEYQDVSQKTGKQQLAALDQYLGTDLGIAGTTAENMRRIYTTAYREGNRAWQTLSSATGGSINPNAAHTKKIGDNPAPGGVRRRTFNPATGKAE
jgi:hypothetical protein